MPRGSKKKTKKTQSLNIDNLDNNLESTSPNLEDSKTVVDLFNKGESNENSNTQEILDKQKEESINDNEVNLEINTDNLNEGIPLNQTINIDLDSPNNSQTHSDSPDDTINDSINRSPSISPREAPNQSSDILDTPSNLSMNENSNTKVSDTSTNGMTIENTKRTIIFDENNSENNESTPIEKSVTFNLENNEDLESKKFILMGMSPKKIIEQIMNQFGQNIIDYTPVEYNYNELDSFIKEKFNNRFILPTEPVLLQRISIYTQLYTKGGLYINPANISLSNSNFEDMFNIPHANVFFILEDIKSKKECQITASAHPIRKGVPEREVQVSSFFIYSKKEKHEIFLDILRLIRKRYNQTVPRNEFIESITKYGRNFLVGSDIINEVIYQNSKKYKDVVILKKESYNNYLKVAIN